MPTYVYKNLATGDTFEIRQPITEPALTEHPETGDPVKRVVQPVGIAFKGSGFYVNDSRGSAGGKASGKAAGKADSKADSKAGASAAESASKPTATPSTSTD